MICVTNISTFVIITHTNINNCIHSWQYVYKSDNLWHRNASVSAKSDALPNIIVIIITFDDYNRDYKVTIFSLNNFIYS